MSTRVVSVRGRKRAEMEADPDFVYVGRAVRFTTWDRRSPFANPFYVGITPAKAEAILRDGRPVDPCDSPVALYARWIGARPGLIARARAELKGKTLGCWCGEWTPGQPDIGCHAVVLAKIADGTIEL